MEGRDCIAAAVSRIAMGLARVGYAASWKRGHVESPARMVGRRSTHPLLSPLGKTFQGRGWNASLPQPRSVVVLEAEESKCYYLPMAESVPTHFNFAREVIDQWAKERPEALGLWCVRESDSGEKKLSFCQLAEQSRRAASFFEQLGIARGERVLLILPRVPQWWIAMLGLIRLWAIPIPGTP